MDLFKKAWKGEASLAKAFWLVYVLGSIVVSLLLTIVLKFVVVDYAYVTHSNLTMSIMFPYTLFAAICVWRCGKNSSKIWNIISKILMVLYILNGVGAIVSLMRGYQG